MIKKLTIAVLLVISTKGFAQISKSPYSFLGLGENKNVNTVENASMGGIGVAMQSIYKANFINPATLSSLYYTTYALGVETKALSLKENKVKGKTSSTHLSYLSVGIPIGKKGGFAFGLLPNTTVGYALSLKDVDANKKITQITTYQGKGGTNKVFLGGGYTIFKNFSVGFEGSYIFGEINNSIVSVLDGSSLASKYETKSKVKGFDFKAGVQYHAVLKNEVKAYFGASFDLENKLEVNGNKYLYSVAASNERPRDTILNKTSIGKIKNPLKSTLGVGFGKDNKWYAAINYSFQNAISNTNQTVLESSSKIKYGVYNKLSVGGFYIPKYNSITNYWQRITYRAGVKYEKTGLQIDGLGNGKFTQLDDFGISFGVGLPMGRNLSNINIGLELGKRGKATSGLVQENYLNLKVGLSFNDKWFKKRQIF